MDSRGKGEGWELRTVAQRGKKKVRKAYFLGEAKETMAAFFKGSTEVKKVANLEEAVRLAKAEAKAGETVLFSPACSSFDQFRDYEERGEKFIKYVG